MTTARLGEFSRRFFCHRDEQEWFGQGHHEVEVKRLRSGHTGKRSLGVSADLVIRVIGLQVVVVSSVKVSGIVMVRKVMVQGGLLVVVVRHKVVRLNQDQACEHHPRCKLLHQSTMLPE
ncbi:MAG: hypothetical protein EDM74_09560 [Armatimonadetes bacterium]|nr:MAG: hypothetical protein EDM74_09560 [Armatimonadota bacterium]